MTNSSPTAFERIVYASMSEAYSKARQLGYTSAQAITEAEMVRRFIRDTMRSVRHAVR
jgi:hypothetical protein